MVELRKRKPPVQPAPVAAPPTKRSTNRVNKKSSVSKPKAAAVHKKSSTATARSSVAAKKAKTAAATAAATTKATVPASASASADAIDAGSIVDVNQFGGELETHDGRKVTLKQLVDESKTGVVIFTYPKASTPGCTNQARLFATAFKALTSAPASLSIYGLSSDSTRANSSFKTKNNLPYTLLSDTQGDALIAPLGFKKIPKGTVRGVVVLERVDNATTTGKARVAVHEKGGPARTLEVVENWAKSRGILSKGDAGSESDAEKAKEEVEDKQVEAAKTET